MIDTLNKEEIHDTKVQIHQELLVLKTDFIDIWFNFA